MRQTHPKTLYACAALGSLGLAAFFLGAKNDEPNIVLAEPITHAAPSPIIPAAALGPVGLPSGTALPLAELVRSDPLGLARLGLERYEKQVREYRCVFLKQERLDGKLTPIQEIEVRYRESPLSVYMIWHRNADKAKRALFIDDGKNVNDKGEKMARVEPAGAIARLFVSNIDMPIHGPEARDSSRRFIDEFGFKSTLQLLAKFNKLAADNGALDIKYTGVGVIDGRPTYVIERHLPYTGPDGIYPDAKMVLHLDQEWLLPLAVYSYADDAGTQLLGSYIYTKIDLNPRFGKDAFKF